VLSKNYVLTIASASFNFALQRTLKRVNTKNYPWQPASRLAWPTPKKKHFHVLRQHWNSLRFSKKEFTLCLNWNGLSLQLTVRLTHTWHLLSDNGVYYFRLFNYVVAEKWISLAISFLQHHENKSQFDEEIMASYTEVLSHIKTTPSSATLTGGKEERLILSR